MTNIVDLMIEERNRLNNAIASLEGKPERVIRWKPIVNGSGEDPKPGRRSFTPEQKAAQAKKMRQYWKRRKAGK